MPPPASYPAIFKVIEKAYAGLEYGECSIYLGGRQTILGETQKHVILLSKPTSQSWIRKLDISYFIFGEREGITPGAGPAQLAALGFM